MGSKSRLIRNGFFLLALLMVPPALAAENPPCIAYAYVRDGYEPHSSLILDNSYVFGSKTMVYSNCNQSMIFVNGELYGYSELGNTLIVDIPMGTYEITLSNYGYNVTYENVTFIVAGQLSSLVNQIPAEHNPYSVAYTPSEISNMELIAGIGSIILSWAIVTSIMWNIIKRHNDNNYCQEVYG